MTAQARLLGGRYQVGELLGYGGMAEVHKGRDLRLGRDVAVKMLRTDLARDETFQERFRREAQNSAALNHPAIVAVYDTGEEISAAGEKQPFIVMEFVNGRTLKEVLAAEQRLQPRRALEIIADICAALEFSHRHGIIHRDIKPGNVMLTQNGQVKVMDFGIARALASGATTMTQTSAVIGTAQYLSPEQARGESVDARSDVYAAGCVLFELLIGHPPFVGDSPVSVAYQHVREDPKAPSDIVHDIPPDVDAIVLKALAKNPLNRYQSAQEMRADALRAVSGRPVMATPVMNEAETMAMAGPPRGYPTGATRPIQAPMMPREPERRTSSWVMAVLAALGVLAVIALAVGLYLTNQNDDPKVRTTAMPSLTELTDKQAKDALAKAGLTGITPTNVEDPTCKEGDVVDQTPTAGDVIPLDKAGSYSVCAGPGTLRVPSGLNGGTYDYVRSTLRTAKFETKKDTEDSDLPKDQVLRLDPPEGSNVDKGSTITIVVSAGNLKAVPNVVEVPLTEAEAQLRALGFTVKTKPGSTVEPGDGITVENQAPGEGTKAKLKSTITLTVTVQREPTAEPSTPGVPDPSQSSGAPGTGTGGGEEDDGGGLGDPLGGLLGG